eukprot:2672885-Rhodomonas_salina.1
MPTPRRNQTRSPYSVYRDGVHLALISRLALWLSPGASCRTSPDTPPRRPSPGEERERERERERETQRPQRPKHTHTHTHTHTQSQQLTKQKARAAKSNAMCNAFLLSPDRWITCASGW